MFYGFLGFLVLWLLIISVMHDVVNSESHGRTTIVVKKPPAAVRLTDAHCTGSFAGANGDCGNQSDYPPVSVQESAPGTPASDNSL